MWASKLHLEIVQIFGESQLWVFWEQLQKLEAAKINPRIVQVFGKTSTLSFMGAAPKGGSSRASTQNRSDFTLENNIVATWLPKQCQRWSKCERTITWERCMWAPKYLSSRNIQEFLDYLWYSPLFSYRSLSYHNFWNVKLRIWLSYCQVQWTARDWQRGGEAAKENYNVCINWN